MRGRFGQLRAAQTSSSSRWNERPKGFRFAASPRCPLRVFFDYFLCTSKESNARRGERQYRKEHCNHNNLLLSLAKAPKNQLTTTGNWLNFHPHYNPPQNLGSAKLSWWLNWEVGESPTLPPQRCSWLNFRPCKSGTGLIMSRWWFINSTRLF